MVIESAVAEAQRRQVQRLLSLVPSAGASRMSRRLGRVGELDVHVREAQYLLPLIIACVEQYSLTRLAEVAESVLPRRTAIASSLLDLGLAHAGQSWDRTAGCWRDWLGIRLADFDHWDVLQGYKEARNAVAHGVDALTAHQMRNSGAVRSTLRHAGIALDGSRLVLNEDHVRACGRTALLFITWLDSQSRTGSLTLGSQASPT